MARDVDHVPVAAAARDGFNKGVDQLYMKQNLAHLKGALGSQGITTASENATNVISSVSQGIDGQVR